MNVPRITVGQLDIYGQADRLTEHNTNGNEGVGICRCLNRFIERPSTLAIGLAVV
jgi:hypothetical protein